MLDVEEWILGVRDDYRGEVVDCVDRREGRGFGDVVEVWV